MPIIQNDNNASLTYGSKLFALFYSRRLRLSFFYCVNNYDALGDADVQRNPLFAKVIRLLLCPKAIYRELNSSVLFY